MQSGREAGQMYSTRLHICVQAQRKEHLLATEDLARDVYYVNL